MLSFKDIPEATNNWYPAVYCIHQTNPPTANSDHLNAQVHLNRERRVKIKSILGH